MTSKQFLLLPWTQWCQLPSLSLIFSSLCRFTEEAETIIEDPPAKSTTIYKGIAIDDDWVASDCSVTTWLLSSMNEVSASIMFVKTIKKIPKKYEIHGRYSNKQKVSRVVVYIRSYSHYDMIPLCLITTLSWRGLSMSWILSTPSTGFKGISTIFDELAMVKFLYKLDTSLDNQVWWKILGGDTVLLWWYSPLSVTLSRVRCVYIGGDSASGIFSSVENFAMVVAGRDRGGWRERGHLAIQGGRMWRRARVHIIVLLW